jgi:hypothetical protein
LIKLRINSAKNLVDEILHFVQDDIKQLVELNEL